MSRVVLQQEIQMGQGAAILWASGALRKGGFWRVGVLVGPDLHLLLWVRNDNEVDPLVAAGALGRRTIKTYIERGTLGVWIRAMMW